jgi:hypothetical protein
MTWNVRRRPVNLALFVQPKSPTEPMRTQSQWRATH